MRVHLDTDIGGDLDDLCALAMLLQWPDVVITGVTTVSEEQGRRAGYARYVLDLAGRWEIPVAAGADAADGSFRYDVLGYPADAGNWPEPIAPRPGPVDAALDLLRHSIEQGATLIGIGPFTNFMRLDQAYPGILRRTPLFLMGGYIDEVPVGFPPWRREDDWNMQLDVEAARCVLEHAAPTLIPLTVTTQTALSRRQLPRLAQAGKLGALIARQAEVFARSEDFEQKFGSFPGLPSDIINFQHDPLACAIALGWRTGVVIDTVSLRLEVRDSWLYKIPDPSGKPTVVATSADARAFADDWCNIICR